MGMHMYLMETQGSVRGYTDQAYIPFAPRLVSLSFMVFKQNEDPLRRLISGQTLATSTET